MSGRAPLTPRRRAQHKRYATALKPRAYARPDPVLVAEVREEARRGRVEGRGLLRRLGDLVRGAK